MSKQTYDSWLDSIPVYIVLITVHAWILLALAFGWTDYGANMQAASAGWHIVGIVSLALAWIVMAIGKTERTFIDFDYPIWVAVFILLYVLPFLALAGFTFKIVS